MKRFLVGLFLCLLIASALAWRPGAPGSDDFGSIRRGTFTATPPTILAALLTEQAVSLGTTGIDAASNWTIVVTPVNPITANMSVADARISSDNTVTMRYLNATALSIVPAQTTFSYVAFK